jgi:hypothetical protein
MGILASGMLVAVSVSLMLASGAGAAEYNMKNMPEIGRCVPVAPHTGEFAGKYCLHAVEGNNGSYNWLSGPAESGKKKFGGSSIEPVKLVTVGGRSVICTAGGTYSGEYTGAKTSTVNIVLRECTYSVTKKPCQNNALSTSGTIEGTGLEGRLGYIIGGEKPQVGWDITQPSALTTTLFSFECGKTPEAVIQKISGSVIARIVTIEKMAHEFTIKFKQSPAGHQVPEKLEGEPTDVMTTTFETGFPPAVETSEQTAMATKLIQSSEEELEYKAKCLGATC